METAETTIETTGNNYFVQIDTGMIFSIIMVRLHLDFGMTLTSDMVC